MNDKQEKPPERISITMDAIARQTLIDALESYSRSLFTGDPAGRIRAARADYLRDALKEAEEIVIAETAVPAPADVWEEAAEVQRLYEQSSPRHAERLIEFLQRNAGDKDFAAWVAAAYKLWPKLIARAARDKAKGTKANGI